MYTAENPNSRYLLFATHDPAKPIAAGTYLDVSRALESLQDGEYLVYDGDCEIYQRCNGRTIKLDEFHSSLQREFLDRDSRENRWRVLGLGIGLVLLALAAQQWEIAVVVAVLALMASVLVDRRRNRKRSAIDARKATTDQLRIAFTSLQVSREVLARLVKHSEESERVPHSATCLFAETRKLPVSEFNLTRRRSLNRPEEPRDM
jgi:hypothetical protein